MGLKRVINILEQNFSGNADTDTSRFGFSFEYLIIGLKGRYNSADLDEVVLGHDVYILPQTTDPKTGKTMYGFRSGKSSELFDFYPNLDFKFSRDIVQTPQNVLDAIKHRVRRRIVSQDLAHMNDCSAPFFEIAREMFKKSITAELIFEGKSGVMKYYLTIPEIRDDKIFEKQF